MGLDAYKDRPAVFLPISVLFSAGNRIVSLLSFHLEQEVSFLHQNTGVALLQDQPTSVL